MAGGGDRSPVYGGPPPGFAAATVACGFAGNQVLEADIREIRRLLKAYMMRVENKDAAAKTTKEWRIVARVLDRLFFLCYIGAIVVSLFTIFPRDIYEGPLPETGVKGEIEASLELPVSSITDNY